MVKVSAQTARNKYYLNLKKFNYILQPYRCSLSCIKGRSDFQVKGLKKVREIQRVRLLTETVLQYFTLMLSSRRGHSIDVSDNIYGCICGYLLQMLF